MIRSFVSASAIAALLVAAAAICLQFVPNLDAEARNLLTSIWCVLPVAWGIWAVVMPDSWRPDRLPAWGAALGVLAGILAVFVLDVPARLTGTSLPMYTDVVIVLLAAGVYSVLWRGVQRVYLALETGD